MRKREIGTFSEQMNECMQKKVFIDHLVLPVFSRTKMQDSWFLK